MERTNKCEHTILNIAQTN